jgi:hypothetical protein
VFFTGAAFTIHGDTYVASQPSSYGCVVSEAVLSCLTHVSAAAIANNLAAAYRAAGRTAEGRTRTQVRSVDQYRPSGQCAGIRIRTSASCPLSGIDAIVPYRPTSP